MRWITLLILNMFLILAIICRLIEIVYSTIQFMCIHGKKTLKYEIDDYKEAVLYLFNKDRV